MLRVCQTPIEENASCSCWHCIRPPDLTTKVQASRLPSGTALSRATVTNPRRAFLNEGVHLVRPPAADTASVVREQLIQIRLGCFPRNVCIGPSSGYALVDTLGMRLRFRDRLVRRTTQYPPISRAMEQEDASGLFLFTDG